MDMACKEKVTQFPALTSFRTKQGDYNHKWIKRKINYDDETKGYPHSFSQDASFFDCRLPLKQHKNESFQRLYSDAALDKTLTNNLERSQVLNWHPLFLKLEAVAVPKDGNCLLHAASFAIWGVIDEHMTLRELLLTAMTINKNDSYKKRWWRQKLLDLKTLREDSQIINKEWEQVVRSISSLSMSGMAKATPYEFLESVHIYVLSNILRRPIVIVADPRGMMAADHCEQDSHISGIYLPLEWPPIKCCKTPLILGFSEGHFCPLLSETSSTPIMNELYFPLVTRNSPFLPVRFLSQHEEHKVSELVQSYFIIKEAIIPLGADGAAPAPCIILNYRNLPPQMDTVMEHFKVCEQLARQQPAEIAELHGKNEMALRHQLQINSQTKVVPMRSFSESYHMRNQASREKAQGQGCLSDEDTRTGSTTNVQDILNQTESIGLGFNPFDPENTGRTVPTAPPASRLNSIEEPVFMPSMMDERCHNKCGYRCSKQTYPYCHECSNFMQANHPVPPFSKNANETGGEGLSFLGLTTPNMNDVSTPQGNLMLFSPLPSPVATDPLAGQALKIEEAKNLRGKTNEGRNSKLSENAFIATNELPPQTRTKLANGQSMMVQLVPGGVMEIILPAENQEHLKALELKGTAMSERRQSAEEEDIIYVSAESASCVSPFCKETVSTPNKLCGKCQAILLRAQKPHKPEGDVQAATGYGIGQMTEEFQAHKLHQIQSGSKNSQGSPSSKAQGTQNLQNEVKVRQRGKPCVTTGCLNYGDPVNADMCSACYNKLAMKQYEKFRREHHKVRAEAQSAQSPGRKARTEPIKVADESMSSIAPSSSFHHRVARPAKAHTVTLPTSAMVTNKTSLSPGSRGSVHGSLENFATFDINAYNQDFAQEYDKFRDQSSSGLKRCKAAACSNYGNPSKGGFCNSCSAKREEKRIQERIARYGENVPDGFSTHQNSI